MCAIKISEAISQNACSNVAHELVIEMDVVFAEELPAQRLARLREVMQIGARVARAGRAGAGGIEFFVGEFVNAAAHLEKTARGEGGAALRQLRRHDAVEHVDAAMDRFEDVERRADAHEIARFVRRQELRGELAQVFALALALADCETADGETIEWHLAQNGGAFAAQLLARARLARSQTSIAANRRARRDCAPPNDA